MRISTSQMHQTALTSILDQQAKLNRTQQQLGTGKKILNPSDDPTGAAKTLQFEQTLSVTDQYQSNADVAKARLGLEENTVSSVTDLLDRVREIALQANNSTLSNQDRNTLAVEVRQRLDELVSYANAKDASGEYLFSGYRGTTRPFAADASGGFPYSGDDGQRFVQIGPNRQVAVGDSGTDVFRKILTGNGTFSVQDNPANTGSGIIDSGRVTNPAAYVADTYTITFTTATTYEVRDSASALVLSGTYASDAEIAFNGIQVSIQGTPQSGDSFTIAPSTNQDIFTTVQNLAVALETGTTNDADKARFANAVNRFLSDVGQGMDNFSAVRAQIGARLNVISDQENLNADYTLQVQSSLSLIQDLDYADAVTRMQQQLAGLQAAQQAYVKVQGLSLFNYI